ncbi:MAG: hypothetical protein JST01_18690, partial [Cyanobacteria bacterium SZAS TMP-1]|nr:hypothetical protein [Cyanobacteria bacterium SZAS TMP-1]
MCNLAKSSVALACSALMAMAGQVALAEPIFLAESLVGAGQFGDPPPAAAAVKHSATAGKSRAATKSTKTARSGKAVKNSKPATSAKSAPPGSYGSGSDNSSSAEGGAYSTPSGGSGFFRSGASPLAGGVTVIDHVSPGGMRLKRATLPIGIDSSGNHGEPVANTHELPLTGSLSDDGTKFQTLFPSLDGSGDPGRTLSGNAQQDKPLAQ